MQIMMAIDSEQRSELEAMIKELEDENRSGQTTSIIKQTGQVKLL